MIKQIIDKNFHTKSSINNGLVRITQKKVVFVLKEISGIRAPQENWGTPNIIRNSTSKELIPYIRGFWDAEGGLPKNPEKTTKTEERYI